MARVVLNRPSVLNWFCEICQEEVVSYDVAVNYETSSYEGICNECETIYSEEIGEIMPRRDKLVDEKEQFNNVELEVSETKTPWWELEANERYMMDTSPIAKFSRDDITEALRVGTGEAAHKVFENEAGFRSISLISPFKSTIKCDRKNCGAPIMENDELTVSLTPDKKRFFYWCGKTQAEHNGTSEVSTRSILPE